MDSNIPHFPQEIKIKFTTNHPIINFIQNITQSSNNNNTCVDSSYGEPFAMFLIGGIGVSILSLVGIIGNILCIIILTRPRMKSSTSIILLGLSFSDLCFVTIAFFIYGVMGLTQYACVWTSYPNIIFPLALKYMYPLISTAQVASSYFTVCVTVERFIVIYWPFHAKTFCTVRNGNRTLVIITVFAILFALPTWWGFTFKDKYDSDGSWIGYTVEGTTVFASPNHKYFYINWIFLIVVHLFPFTLLAVLNLVIYKRVRVANRARKCLTQSESNEISITKMLIWIVCIFLVCNLLRVYLIMRLAITNQLVSTELFTLSGLFLNINSAVNFIIYCLVGVRFRETFAQLFCTQLNARNYGSSIIP